MVCKTQYCDNPELIENYDLAIADTTKTWICHHRLEKDYTVAELKSMGLYYHRPPEELIFVETQKVHKNLPHKGKPTGSPKNNWNSKSVLCVETEIVYPSTMEAERQTGIYQSNITKCCNGKRKSAGGFHWQFVN